MERKKIVDYPYNYTPKLSKPQLCLVTPRFNFNNCLKIRTLEYRKWGPITQALML